MSIKYFSVLSGSLFASLIVLTSCLPSEDSLTNDTAASNTSVPDINGSWSPRGCEDSGSDGYYQSWVTFNTLTSTLVSSEATYSDANCLIIIRESSDGAYWFTLGETITTDSGLAAREINVFQTEGMLTAGMYSILRLDGDLLYLGDTTSTPEDRPTSLDFENPATRI
jgi:hypothetical protein